MTSKGPFQPKAVYDSVIHSKGAMPWLEELYVTLPGLSKCALSGTSAKKGLL